MKHTHAEPNSNSSKQWAEYKKSWQLNKKLKSTTKRSLKRKALPKPSLPTLPQQSFFSVQEIRHAAMSHTVSVRCSFKQELLNV